MLWRGNRDEVEVEVGFGGRPIYVNTPFDPRAEDPRAVHGV